MYQSTFKPILDFSLALIGLIVLSPVFLIVMILLAIKNKGNPFFLQKRPGKNEKIFTIIKFKTMTDEKDKHGDLLPDTERITKLGSFVRKTSLDEIPQLINVVKGDMSLVGPRPLLPLILPLYSDRQRRRHEVKPGITGWAQVNGRNLLKLSQKFEYDVWYVDNISFKTDFKIIILTIENVLKSKDIGEGAGNIEEIDDLQFTERLEELKRKELI